MGYASRKKEAPARAFPDYTSAAPTPFPLMGEGWGGGENLLRFRVFPPP